MTTQGSPKQINQHVAPGLLIAIIVMLLPSSHNIAAASFEREIKPFLDAYCIKCHGGEKTKGGVDFTRMKSTTDLDSHFETWETAVELLKEGEMPPDAAKQPSARELQNIYLWYQDRFVDNVKARPAVLKPRRLSATEYRNTLRSLFGFDLQVAIIEAEQTFVEKSLVLKLLPEDPPGKSGFKNDTSGNPLTTGIWDQYSYLTEAAIEDLFSSKRSKELEAIAGPVDPNGFSVKNAEQLFRTFVPRAVRRSVPESDIKTYLDNVRESSDLIAAIKLELKSLLMSPQFIYRSLLAEGPKGIESEVDSFELAERLSYFIWADMPDAELLALASQGTLGNPEVYRAQITRLLDSPKARTLADDFASQWLTLNEVAEDRKQNIPIAHAFKSQPLDFMNYLFTEDRPLMELIDSKAAFVNKWTAGFYKADRNQMERYRKQRGIEQERVPNQRITLTKTKNRGGLLTIPGVLAMNRGPVLRGTWMLERILGEHLPDPPPDVGQVPKNKRGENLSFRQRFELHRNNQACAFCHDKIDPLGFALEEYNDKGEYVGAENGNATSIDSSGQLPSGEKFKNFTELKQLLVTTEREAVTRNIVKRTLSYALCRKLEIFDQPAVQKMVTELMESNGTYRDLVRLTAESLPFRKTIIQ